MCSILCLFPRVVSAYVLRAVHHPSIAKPVTLCILLQKKSKKLEK